MTRLRQLRPLLRHLLRAMQWQPLVGATAVSCVVTFLLTRRGCIVGTGDPACLDAPAVVRPLRLSGVVLAASAAFLLEDPAAGTTEAAPTPRAFPLWIRVAVAVIATATAWGAATAIAGRNGTPAEARVGELFLEVVSLALLGLGATAVISRRARQQLVAPSTAAPLVVVIAAVGALLPPGYRLLPPDAAAPDWNLSRRYWMALLVIGAATIAVSHYSPRASRRGLWSAPPTTAPPASREVRPR